MFDFSKHVQPCESWVQDVLTSGVFQPSLLCCPNVIECSSQVPAGTRSEKPSIQAKAIQQEESFHKTLLFFFTLWLLNERSEWKGKSRDTAAGRACAEEKSAFAETFQGRRLLFSTKVNYIHVKMIENAPYFWINKVLCTHCCKVQTATQAIGAFSLMLLILQTVLLDGDVCQTKGSKVPAVIHKTEVWFFKHSQ